MNRKILFIDTTHPCLKEELEKLGFVCDFFPEYHREDYLNCINEYFGIIIRSKIKLDKEILDKADKLKFIGRVGAGLENIDVEYADSKGISCLNSPEGNRDAVAEHTLGLLLSLVNNICKSNNEISRGLWLREANRGTELKGKTIGILGYGNMGSAFARILKGFMVNVIAYDKYKTKYTDENVKEVTLQEFFKETDFLCIHLPLNEETHYIIDNNFINTFSKNIYLINTSRGNILKTDDLVNNLKNGKIRGAALDVIEYEDHSFEKINKNILPESYNFLINSNNVILTPHIAGWSFESHIKLSMVLVDKIKKML